MWTKGDCQKKQMQVLSNHSVEMHRQLRKQSSYCSNGWPAQCQVIDSARHRDPGKVSQINSTKGI